MRTFTGLVAGVLLAVLALACSLSSLAVEAKSDKPAATAQAVKKVAKKPLHPAWRIGAARSFNNMTVFPVVSNEPTNTAEFITLAEGLRSGKVIITELGANGSSRRVRHNQQLGDGAEVNKLALTNKSGKMLVLIAGELLIGGKQDRIVGHDCIVASTNTPVPLDVFCVEHGRWSGEASFNRGRPGINASASSVDGINEARNGAAMEVIAMPNVRAKAQAEKSQTEVWAKVEEAQTENVVVTASSDLLSVYKDKRVTRKVDPYQRAFKNKFAESNVVGVVVAVGDRIISADVFASHLLFQAYWPKMLKSYALEALNSAATSNQRVDRSDAESYLARVQGESATGGEPNVYRLAENQSGKDASFELEATKKKPTLIHFNRVSKQ